MYPSYKLECLHLGLALWFLPRRIPLLPWWGLNLAGRKVNHVLWSEVCGKWRDLGVGDGPSLPQLVRRSSKPALSVLHVSNVWRASLSNAARILRPHNVRPHVIPRLGFDILEAELAWT